MEIKDLLEEDENEDSEDVDHVRQFLMRRAREKRMEEFLEKLRGEEEEEDRMKDRHHKKEEDQHRKKRKLMGEFFGGSVTL
jgi:hypothetical protein